MSKKIYDCLVLHQRNSSKAPAFCVFNAPAGEVLEWAAIRRLEEEARAPQRRLNEAKIRAIRAFLRDNPANTIPTAVTVTLKVTPSSLKPKDGTTYKKNARYTYTGEITIRYQGNREKPGLVIDGQHRLIGIKDYKPEIPVTVVALLNADDVETAFQFLVINNKSSKVAPDHFKALALEFKDDELEDRLKTARMSLKKTTGFIEIVDNDAESPFRAMVDWALNRTGNRRIVPAAIEQSLAYLQSKINVFEDDDILLEFFFTIWSCVKEAWPKAWEGPESKLLDKIGIVCMTAYLGDALVAAHDLGRLNLEDPDEVKNSCEQILKYQAEDLWTARWASSSYDTKAGRQLVVDSLVQINRNLRAKQNWRNNVPLVADIASTE